MQAGQVAAYRLYGALFFGAVRLIENLQDALPDKVLVLDLKNVMYVDSSGMDALNGLAQACQKNHTRLLVCGLTHQPLDMARRCGFTELAIHIYPDLQQALAAALTSPGSR
jgi:SulP family sulfate permease